MKLRLIEIGEDGSPSRCPGNMPPAARDVVEGTLVLYQDIGFQRPWIGYLADRDGEVVGACAFLSLPRDGAVEMRCESFPEYRARGVGSEMARQLVRLARAEVPDIEIRVRTDAQEDHTTRKLRELGFDPAVPLEVGDDQWQWRLRPEQAL